MDLSIGQTFNAAAFVLHNDITNETGDAITFTNHRFLRAFYMDETPELVAKKCSQVGFSTTAILRSYHLAKYRKANTIYLLPSKTIVKDFVVPKVDPLIKTNPVLQDMMGATDNLGLKSVGQGKEQRFIYFRSSWDESSAISISSHILIADEYDRSNIKSINTYKTRLDAAKLTRPDLGWDWRFSNPSIEGYGVDELYDQSDKKRWMIKCQRCNGWQCLTWPDNIDIERECYICSICKRPLSEDDRARGRWVKTYFGRSISGYWINQMMASWIPAKKIIKDSKGDQSIFYNFTLGMAYTSKDIKVTREALLNCLAPGTNPQIGNAIGVDNGKVKHFVIGNRFGIFKMGATESWDDIEQLRNRYAAVMVIDSNPYPAPVKKLCEKYPGKVFAHFYKENTKTNETTIWGKDDKDMIVESDRTKIIDAMVADINAGDQVYQMTVTDMENAEYFEHWGNLYRIVVEDDKGNKRGVWMTIGQNAGGKKADHLAHATVLFSVALQQTLTVGGIAHTPAPKQKAQEAVYATEDGMVHTGFDLNKLREQLGRPKMRGWKQN